MRNVRTVNVLGVRISVIDQDVRAANSVRCSPHGRRGYVTVTGVHGVMEAQENEEFRAILNNALLTTPDGMPMVWMGKLQGERHIARVYGPDLRSQTCASTHASKIFPISSTVDRGGRELRRTSPETPPSFPVSQGRGDIYAPLSQAQSR